MSRKRLIGLDQRPDARVMRDTNEIRVNQKGKRSRKSIGWFFVKGQKCLNFWVDYAGNEDFLTKLTDEELQWYTDFLIAYYSRTGDHFKEWPIAHKRKSYSEHKRRTQDVLNPFFDQKNYPRKLQYFTQLMEETISVESEDSMIDRIYNDEIQTELELDEKDNRRAKNFPRGCEAASPRRQRKNAQKHTGDSQLE